MRGGIDSSELDLQGVRTEDKERMKTIGAWSEEGALMMMGKTEKGEAAKVEKGIDLEGNNNHGRRYRQVLVRESG